MNIEQDLKYMTNWIYPIPRYRGATILSSKYWEFERWEYAYSTTDSLVFKHKTKNAPYFTVLISELPWLISSRTFYPAMINNEAFGLYEGANKSVPPSPPTGA